MTPEQLSKLTNVVLEAVKKQANQSAFGMDRCFSINAVADIDTLHRAKEQYAELLKIIRGPEPLLVKSKAARLYFDQLAGSANMLVASNLVKYVGTTQKLLAQGKAIEGLLDETRPPNRKHIEEDLARLVERWGENIKITDEAVVTLLLPTFTANHLDKMRKTWSGLTLEFKLAAGPTAIKPDFIPGTVLTTCTQGYPGQPHPHIHPKKGEGQWGGLCYGSEQGLLAVAYADGRIDDYIGIVVRMMHQPLDSTSHTTCFYSHPDTEFKCCKCGKWECRHPDDALTAVQLKYQAVKQAPGLPGSELSDVIYTCLDCSSVVCPATGLKFREKHGIPVNGTFYHPAAVQSWDDEYYLTSECERCNEVYVPKKLLFTCMFTGHRSVAHKPNASISWLSLVPLPNGKAVTAGCLDLVDQDGNPYFDFDNTQPLFGASNAFKPKPTADIKRTRWWVNKYKLTSFGGAGSQWHDQPGLSDPVPGLSGPVPTAQVPF